MEKNYIKVPKNIRYIGQWKKFYEEFRRFPHILDKQIPGCGFTEFCLTNPDNVILCSPRNMLILNKWEQHPEEVYRVFNEKFNVDLGVDKDISDERKYNPVAEKIEEQARMIKEEDILSFNQELRKDLEVYIKQRVEQKQPLKILVTYDSFRILKDVLTNYFGIFDEFQIIVDEFQSVFTDSRFKSDTEMEFVNTLQGIEKVCYVSATPMMGEYLEKIPEFRDLPYFELDWKTENPIRVMKPNLEVRIIDSIYSPLKGIIESYKAGKFEKKPVRLGNGDVRMVESREAMFYMNSVNNIINTIKKNGLVPEECNILCSNTPENLKKIQKALGTKWKIGKVPLKNEPRKMFTFCTRTVYLGADFYSDNAKTFIFSDANIGSLAVDISLDLPQIMGRQRLIENPWKNSASFYFKPLKNSVGEYKTPEEFNEIIRKKVEDTESLIRTWKNTLAEKDKHVLAEVYEREAAGHNYKNNYVSVNKHKGADLVPEMNYLVMIAEKRAYDIQQIDYKDRFTVFNALADMCDLDPKVINEIQTFLDCYNNLQGIQEKLKFVNECGISQEAANIAFSQIDAKVLDYLTIGHDRLIELSYHLGRIKADLEKIGFDKNELTNEIYKNFKVGDRISKAEIKERLKEIYNNLEYKANAKANDIESWFEIKPVSIFISGKKVNGFEILKKNQN